MLRGTREVAALCLPTALRGGQEHHAFDLAAMRLLPLATVIRETPPEHHAALLRHILERVVIEAGGVGDVKSRLEPRPFFAAMRDGMGMAPPEGIEGSPSKADPLDWYASPSP
jgi:hypothetical protein